MALLLRNRGWVWRQWLIFAFTKPRHGPDRARAARTRYMSENWSSSLGLALSLKNSGKSSVVVWKNLPTGGLLDTRDFPRASPSGNPSEQPCFLERRQIYPKPRLG